MSARAGILLRGNWIVDKLKVVDVYPQQDALANIIGESIGNGGSPFNIGIDLAKMGARFPLAGVGLVGADADGEWIAGRCRVHGIEATQLRVQPGVPTSYTDVMTVRTTGRRTFFHQRGANAFLDVAHFEFESAPKIFHLGYLLLLDRLDAPDAEFGTVAARVLAAAAAAGCRTSVDVVSEDTDRFAQVVLPALPHVDYCVLNEFELERTTGIQTRRDGTIDLAAVGEASRRLLAAGVRQWVVVHFPEGACALGPDGGMRVQGSVRLPKERVVSAVGAGDAFAAGLLYGLHEDCEIETALRYGTVAAASCLLGVGCSDAILPLDDCLELAAQCGTRDLTAKLG